MIVNPASASSSGKEHWKDAESILKEGGLDLEMVFTERKGHAIELAGSAAAAGARRFIATGGDGTIHEVMTGLLRYSDKSGVPLDSFTLGVLPYGTGNDWIKTAGVPADMSEAARCIVRGKTAPEDVVRLTLPAGVFCMANIAGIGLDADVCLLTNALKKSGFRGAFLYKLATVWSILTRRRNKVEIVCDGETVYNGKMYTAVLANGVYRGGGVAQNEPGGTWNDGILEVSVMPAVCRIKCIFLMTHALKGDFASQPGIITKRFRKMTVTPLGNADNVESDGEIPGTVPLTVEVTGQQINVIVP